MSKLHIFDMDGTLLDGSACLHISQYMGVIEQVNRIEEAWGRGEVGHVEFYELCLPLWAGLQEDDIDRIFATAPWIENIPAVFEDIAARGEYSAVITLSPMFFADRLRQWGVTTAHGALVLGGVVPDPAPGLTPDTQVAIMKSLLEHYGLQPSDCIAYGDSSSDIPLFKTLTNTVAVNAPSKLSEIAAAHYSGRNMWDAYMIGRTMASAS
jgi:phosphoserine phosphatase